MINRSDILNKYQGISEGTPVYSQDGEKLGKVALLSDDSFIIEKGLFFPKDFSARYEDIVDVRDGSIYLAHSRDNFDTWRNERYEGWSQVDDVNEGRLDVSPRDEYRDRYADWGRDDESRRVQLAEERLEVNKTARQAGEVKLRKIVHTELRHFTVPVMREEVRVERVPVSGERAEGLRTGEAFKEDTISVPVMEEEVTISKRPVVKEEVVLHKERVEEQRDVSGEVRREDIKIDDTTRTGKKKTA